MLTAADILKTLDDVPIEKDQYGIVTELIREYLDGNESFADGNYQRFDERFGSKPIRKWMCSDSIVGFFALYLDDEFVGFGHQRYRKGHMDFGWLSVDVGQKVRDFVVEIFKPEPDKPHFSTFTMDEDFEACIRDCDEAIALADVHWKQQRAWMQRVNGAKP